MNRRTSVGVLTALWAVAGFAAAAPAASVWVSLNLKFNVQGDFNSGGTWTTVAKAEPFGIAGIFTQISSATTFGSFLSPPQWAVHVQGLFVGYREILTGDDISGPVTLGIGTIGSSFPSTYVDPAGLIPYGGYPDLGSFTGGVALATGGFPPGVIPNWVPGSTANGAGANTWDATSHAVAATTFVTVRYVVPEPATWPCLAAGAVVIAAVWRRRSGA